MAEILTYTQNLAVNNRGGKLLVSAAAGSGKTKVLVDRLLKYLTDPIAPANIDEFLMITYTKAAAAELRGKIAAKLSECIAQDPSNHHLQRQMQRLYLTKIATVHAFCAEILREYSYRLDISPDFRVGDENECTQLRVRGMETILEEAYEQLGNDPDIQAFVDTQGLGRSDALVPEIIEQVYDSAMCHLDPDKWFESCIVNAEIHGVSEPLDTLWGRYLADRLFTCLDEYIAAMERCSACLDAIQGMEKPAALLQFTLQQMVTLRNSQSWDEILARKDIDYGRLVFPKKLDDPAITEPIKAVRKACKDALEKRLRWFSDPGDQVLSDLTQSASAAKGLIKLVKRFSACYGRLKMNRRILDFSDLEHRSLDLLWGKRRTGITSVAAEIGAKFREIMVDEYQDSNGVQDAIFTALTHRRQNLFMVGDVKQSIYQFRLADPGIFLEKYASYVDAEKARDGQGRKILLSSNFRSGGGVISAVNDVFYDCMSEAVGGLVYGEGEALQEGIPHIPLGEAEVELHGIAVQESTYPEEAAYVAERIKQLLNGDHFVRDGGDLRPIREEDIVILLRSPGSVGMEFQHALQQRGIPCAGSTGGDLLLTEEIGTLRALLQIISNPRQDIPLIAALASPVFGFTADELAFIRSKSKKGCIYDALRSSDLKKTEDFITILSELRKCAGRLTLPELLELVYRLTRMDTIYSAMQNGRTRRDNLQAFYQLAVDFSTLGFSDLDRFLEYLAALEDRGIPTSDQQPSGCVTIMSIHKSKGLEFPVVFLCGLSRRFNLEDTRQQVLCHKAMGLGLSCIDREKRVRYPAISKYAIGAKILSENISEELRVLYVAMTRARDRLIMTYASQHLEKDIQDIAMRMDLSGQRLMTEDVSCPGDWVLYSALKRTEAGALFAAGDRPRETRPSDHPWKITVSEAALDTFATELPTTEPLPAERELDYQKTEALLRFDYAHTAATKTPSKQTATQRKGRAKDQEAAEDTTEPKPVYRVWRKPAFSVQSVDGAAYGNAIHAVMQYISYEACSSEAGVRTEIQRLVQENYITQEQGILADSGKIAAFFASPLGCRLRTSDQVLREFKFSVLDDAAQYGESLDGERVLLQGVVDCALIEEDGITVVDFKTDHVSGGTLVSLADKYSPQVQTYADALERIFQKPVKAKALYLFGAGEFLWL